MCPSGFNPPAQLRLCGMLISQPRLLFSCYYFLVVEALAHTGSVATEPVREGGVSECVCVVFFLNMGLNDYIGSCLNYRRLFLSQHHCSILEALLCSTVCFFPLFFFFTCLCVCVAANVVSRITCISAAAVFLGFYGTRLLFLNAVLP